MADTATTAATTTTAIDDLTWDDWDTATLCSLENGEDCTACEG